MMFLDYEKIIRDNYPVMVESYVKQYGEKYREHINDVLNRVKYCIYETPVNISEYVNRKMKEDFIKAILDSYMDLGIDISGIKIDDDGLVFENTKVGELTKIFFPIIDDMTKIKQRGIFTFSKEFDNLSFDDPIFKERIKVLEKLKLKSVDIPIEEYVKTREYIHNCRVFKKTLSVFSQHILNRCNDDYSAYVKYAAELENKLNLVAEKYERDYLLKIREFLSEDDKVLLDNGASIKELSDYYLYFDDSVKDNVYVFSEGVLEYFCDFYTELLINKHTKKDMIKEIIDKRIKYLEKRGYDVSSLNREELCCDWSQLSYLKGYLPDNDFVLKCLSIRDTFQDEYERDIAQACIINDYKINLLDPSIEVIIDSDGHSYSFDSMNGNFDSNHPTPIVCISPLNDIYNLFDIAIDHELRHAIETTIKKNEEGYLIKVGVDIAEYDLNFKCIKGGFTDYNERVTQKLSLESCRKRWLRGEYIFSDPYALITICDTSCYDYDIDNLDIIFEPFREELIESQISSDFDKIYEVIPKKTLSKINSSIICHSKATTKKLYKIKEDLLKEKSKDLKIRKLGTK